jgi:hypothetical protein
VLRKLFSPKTEEVTRDWRKFYNKDLHVLYSSPNIIQAVKSRRMIWDVARVWERRGAYSGFFWGGGRHEGKGPLGSPKCYVG